jgi:hypothetical protein
MCIDLFEWAIACKPVAIREALTELPKTPGIYVICVDFPATLPEPFRSILAKRTPQTLIYIGQASKSLYKRVWEEECLHKSPGTFFRSVGVMLGYVSPSGGKNFEFQKPDKEAITKWILRHLSDRQRREGVNRKDVPSVEHHPQPATPPTSSRASGSLETGNSGTGIPADKLKSIFEPFFTTKRGGWTCRRRDNYASQRQRAPIFENAHL